MRRIVSLALPAHAYDIVIGAGVLAEAGDHLRALMPGAKAAIVTDETVAALHHAPLAATLTAAGIGHRTIALPAGEATKSFAQLAPLMDALLGAQIERGDMVIALGGGVIGDLAGFAAAILRRGVRFVQVPTTLLAQVDSSVGGKTGINAAAGKNLIGAFHQPSLVLADTAVLASLPLREMRAGYAEVAKYGLLGDAAFYSWLEAGGATAVLAGDPAATLRAVETSCRAKAAIVMRDEREAGDRALLNLGHTFGHALEAHAGFSQTLLHGEAIAIGMTLAFAFSQRRGLLPASEAARVARHFAAAGLPTHVADVAWGARGVPTADALLARMMQDKKVARGALTFILARAIGEAFIARDVAAGEVEAFLAEALAG